MKLSERMPTTRFEWAAEVAQLEKENAQLKRENEALKETIRIDWEVIVDAIDDHDIKQAAIRLWNRADALLTEQVT